MPWTFSRLDDNESTPGGGAVNPTPTLGEHRDNRLVEAAGIEPLLPANLNPMMVHDFGFYCLKSFKLPRRFESPGVPSSPLESSPVLEIYWRRRMAGQNGNVESIGLRSRRMLAG